MAGSVMDLFTVELFLTCLSVGISSAMGLTTLLWIKIRNMSSHRFSVSESV